MKYTIKVNPKYTSAAEWDMTADSAFEVTNIEGLVPPAVDIALAVGVNRDGGIYKASRMNERNIVIEAAVNEPAVENRLALYGHFPAHQLLTLKMSDGERSVHIDGYVESIEVGIFDKREKAQISIICPSPAFVDDTSVTGIIVKGTSHLIVNDSDLSCGVIMRLTASGTDAVSPAVRLNYRANGVLISQWMRFAGTIPAGDTLIIDTIPGEKSITLSSGGTETNALSMLDLSASEWLSLPPGTVYVAIDSEGNAMNLEAIMTYTKLYGGI
ncbi:MAG: phage tail family protein [Clostridia bacterium]|nr:phage tail family protein [Clostridia bacterium]